MLKTKIVCTLGPSTDDPEVLRELMLCGMSVARINFSHGTIEQHLKRINQFKEVREKLGLPIALMLDTRGPEIRVGRFKGGRVELTAGSEFSLRSVRSGEEMGEGDETYAYITCDSLPRSLKIGDSILMDDGLISLSVCGLKENEVVCRVMNGGSMTDNKSINIPGSGIRLPYMSEKDRSDIIFGAENEFDFIAASFVRTPEDVMEVRKILDENGGENIEIIAKIENGEGVKNIDAIIEAAGGIMIARGDMGVEIPLEEIPHIQKDLIRACYSAGKRVITATQMLDSMIRNPRPTRAEVTDIANAIYDGTSAIMLSGETAAGKYPLESLKTMARIALKAESSIDYRKRFDLFVQPPKNITDGISHATCTTAHDLNAAAIITVTASGRTARMISKYRPDCTIIAAAISETICRQLALSWGVRPMMAEIKESTDELFDHVVLRAQEMGYVKKGDITVLTAGIPVGIGGSTNILKVHQV